MKSYFAHPLKYLFGCFSSGHLKLKADFHLLKNIPSFKDDKTAFYKDIKNLEQDFLHICSYFPKAKKRGEIK